MLTFSLAHVPPIPVICSRNATMSCRHYLSRPDRQMMRLSGRWDLSALIIMMIKKIIVVTGIMFAALFLCQHQYERVHPVHFMTVER